MSRWICLLLLSGCAGIERAPLPPGGVVFDPSASEIEGWIVDRLEPPGPLCPDDAPPRIYVARPAQAPEILAMALVLHGGALDAVATPSVADPLRGVHFATPDRLSREWSVRAAFAALGMEDDGRVAVDSQGALAAALAEQGVALVVPANCWGDLWRNSPDQPNAPADGFERSGLVLAQAALDLLEAGELGSQPDQTWLVGLGFGARGVAELLHAGAPVDGVLVDSASDDLTLYWADPLYADTAAALDRVFPEGPAQTTAHTLAAATLPTRSVYLWSTLDPELPVATHAAALAAFEAAGGTTLDTQVDAHESSSGDLDVAREAAASLLGLDPTEDER